MIKIAKKRIFFHGSSELNLKTILSEGLVTYRKKVWTHEFSQQQNRDYKSLASYGGIYLTDNFMSAYGAAGTANRKNIPQGKNTPRVIVIVQIEDSTPHIILDEDRVSSPELIINQFFHVNANDYFYINWIKQNFDDIEEVAIKYLDQIFYGTNIHPEQEKSLINIAIQVIKSFCYTELSRNIKRYGKPYFYGIESSDPIYSLDLAAEEGKYRSSHDLLISKAKNLTKHKDNVRSLENISFSGKNKILSILLIKHSSDPKYYEIVDIYYMSNDAIGGLQEFINQYSERVAPNIIIKNINNNHVYYDNPESVKTNVATNWFYRFNKQAMPLPFFDTKLVPNKIGPGAWNIESFLTDQDVKEEEKNNPSISYFNAGQSGAVYDTSKGTVIKYTASKQEYEFATRLMKNPLPCFVKVYGTRKVNNDVYAIEAEKVKPIENFYAIENFEKRFQCNKCIDDAKISCTDIGKQNFGETEDGRFVLLDLDWCFFRYPKEIDDL